MLKNANAVNYFIAKILEPAIWNILIICRDIHIYNIQLHNYTYNISFTRFIQNLYNFHKLMIQGKMQYKEFYTIF